MMMQYKPISKQDPQLLRTHPCLQQAYLFAILLGLIGCPAIAQKDSLKNAVHDTSFFETFDGYFTGRFYFSNKFVTPDFIPANNKQNIVSYRPNTPITMGVGATYQWLTLNLAYGFKFLNQYKSNRGETRYLDLQSHSYGRRGVIDFYGQLYKGFYLKPVSANPSNYYTRPDIGITQIGGQYEHLFNWRKFSYRAAMLQSERQLKSAGSFTTGFEANFTIISADSSFVPSRLPYAGMPALSRIRHIEFGPLVGYAYTLVLWQNVFVHANVTGYADINFTKATIPQGAEHTTVIRPDFAYRFAAGINRPQWAAAITWINNQLNTPVNYYRYRQTSGLLRLTFNYRLPVGPKLEKWVRPVAYTNEKVLSRIRSKQSVTPPTN